MDDAKRRILARRAKFVAAALAGVAGATDCVKNDPPPVVQVPVNDIDGSSTATSSGSGSGSGSGSNDAGLPPAPDPDTRPMPCLVPPPTPTEPPPVPTTAPTPSLSHYKPPPLPPPPRPTGSGPNLPFTIKKMDGGSFRPCLMMLLRENDLDEEDPTK